MNEFLMSNIGCNIEDMRLLTIIDNPNNRLQYPIDDSIIKLLGSARSITQDQNRKDVNI